MEENMRRTKGLNFNHKRRKIKSAVLKEIFSWILGVFLAVFTAFLVVYSVGMTTSVIGISMKPTLENGEKVMINRLAYCIAGPKQNDVVAFAPKGNMNSHYYIKRIVGVPGDTIQIVDGHLYVNGEIYLYEDNYDEIAQPGIAANEITLGKGEYFVMGDNRNNSEDSRSANIGIVKKKDLIGKAWFHLGAGENTIGFVK